jgi:hypothetical protein
VQNCKPCGNGDVRGHPKSGAPFKAKFAHFGSALGLIRPPKLPSAKRPNDANHPEGKQSAVRLASR